MIRYYSFLFYYNNKVGIIKSQTYEYGPFRWKYIANLVTKFQSLKHKIKVLSSNDYVRTVEIVYGTFEIFYENKTKE